jgi:uncharacterized protein (PEP-CTERM system associated)
MTFRPAMTRLLAVALGGVPAMAGAQAHRSELSVQSSLTATDNSAGAAAGAERADLLLSVRPHFQFVREGAGLQLRGTLAADFVASARGTRRDRVLPAASVDAQASLIERTLFLDAAMNVQQVEVDPFGARADGGSTRNARTAGSYRVSPFLQVDTGDRSSLLARLDARTTRVAGTQDGDVTTGRATAKFDVRPQPIGASIEWLSEDTDFAAVSESDVRIDRLLGSLNYAVTPDWIVGVAAGSERSRIAGNAQTDRVTGVKTYWVPGPRTDFAASIDRRFFGTGWNVGLKHRTPRMSLRLRVDREPVVAGAAGAGGLATFLDAILTTRNPQAVARSALVSELVSSRGLQGSLATASAAGADYAQLRSAGDLAWVYLGPRTSVSLSIYAQTMRRLARADGSAVVPGAVDADNRQRGASFGWNHKMSPVTSLDTTVGWSRIEGLELRSGERTREATLRVNVVRALAERTTASAGLMVRRVATNANNVSSFDETAAFVGLGHRF